GHDRRGRARALRGASPRRQGLPRSVGGDPARAAAPPGVAGPPRGCRTAACSDAPAGAGTAAGAVDAAAMRTARRPRDDESALVAALRAGDERAFVQLVHEHTPGMRRFALTFVRTPAVADDVVQEAWLGVLRGLDRFEGRSSLRTWIYRIVANIARTRAVKEARSAPFSSFGDEPSVDPERFIDGHWAEPPEPWR